MANDITGRVWSLDTAGVITTGPVKIDRIIFEPGANSDNVVLEDNQGKEIISWTAAADITTQEQFGSDMDGRWFQGLNLTTIDGGTLKVHVA